MFALTVAAWIAVVGAFLVYQGATLPRVPVRFSGDWLMERDDWIGFVPARNGSTEFSYVGSDYRYHIFTDRRRARVNAAGEQTAPTVDVLAIGCSFTWGAGIDSEHTYIQQLGRILDVSVANLAMGSYGSVQAFQMLVRNPDLKPKVIVYGFINDHLRRNVSPCAPNYVPNCMPVAYLQREGNQVVLREPHMELFTPEDNRAFNFEVAMREPTDVGALLLGAKWAAKIAWIQYTAPTVVADQSPEMAAIALKVMIHAMAEEARKVGAHFVVLNMPFLKRGSVQPAAEDLMNAIAGLDLTFVDFAPVAAAYYRDNATGTLIQWGDDPHPNALANRMIAETLAAAVQPLLEARGSVQVQP